MRALPALMVLAALLGGCSHFRHAKPSAPVAAGSASASASGGAAGPVDANGTPIEKLPFRLGVSSNTVEKMGRQQACTSGQGAGLVTGPGPVEVYRMQCDNGKVFMARCELRQCRQM